MFFIKYLKDKLLPTRTISTTAEPDNIYKEEKPNGLLYRARMNKVGIFLRVAKGRRVMDTIDASNAMQRNANIIEELDTWYSYYARKNYLIDEVLKHDWTVSNCPEYEKAIKESWGSKLDDIHYHLVEAIFNGKCVLKIFTEEKDFLWKHPSFVAAQESDKNPNYITWWVLPVFGGDTVGEPKPITRGDYIFWQWYPRDRNYNHGEGLIEAAYELKRDFDEVRMNWRRFNRKFSTAIFKYHYSDEIIDPVNGEGANQAKIDEFLEELTDTETSVAIPLKMDGEQKLEDIEMIQVQTQNNMFSSEFKRIKQDLEELITRTSLSLGLDDGQGSYSATKEYKKNVAVLANNIEKKIAEVMNDQFHYYRWLEMGGMNVYPTTDGKPPRASFIKPADPEDKEQVNADLAKFDRIVITNTPISQEDWYRLLHLKMPAGLDPGEVIDSSKFRPDKVGGFTPFDVESVKNIPRTKT